MDTDKIMEFYSYICSNYERGVSVGELTNKFYIKKKDIIRFLSLLQEFDEKIEFHYFSPEDEEFIDDINDIEDDTIIDIFDDFKNISLKLDIRDTIRLFEIYEDSYMSSSFAEKLLIQFGQPLIKKFQYINKGYPKIELKDKTIMIKNEIVKCIENKFLIYFEYHSKSKNIKKHFINVLPLGIFFDEFKKLWFFVGKENQNSLFELRIDRMKEIKIKEKNLIGDISFDINEYINNKRDTEMVLKVFDEANVVAKLESLFQFCNMKIEKEEVHYVFKIMVDDALYFKPLIDSFGKSVMVLKPESLRHRIEDASAELLDRYEKIR